MVHYSYSYFICNLIEKIKQLNKKTKQIILGPYELFIYKSRQVNSMDSGFYE